MVTVVYFCFCYLWFCVISKKLPRPMPRNFSRIFYFRSLSGVIFESSIHKGSISLFLYVDTQFSKTICWGNYPCPCVFLALSLFIIIIDIELTYSVVSFRCTAKWFIYVFISYSFSDFSHYRLLQDIKHSSLCNTVGPCISLLYIVGYSINLKLLLHPSLLLPFPLW